MKKRVTNNKANVVMRRPALVPHQRCGRCVFLRSYHKKFFGECATVFSVTGDSIACKEFKLNITAKPYRADTTIKRYNRIARQRFSILLEWEEDIKALTSKAIDWSEDEHVLELLKGNRQAALPLFVKVQKRHTWATVMKADIDEKAESIGILHSRSMLYLYENFPELQTLSPAAVRNAIVGAIFSDIISKVSLAKRLSSACYALVRNASAGHNTLLEMQATILGPTAVAAPSWNTPNSIRRRGGVGRGKGTLPEKRGRG